MISVFVSCFNEMTIKSLVTSKGVLKTELIVEKGIK